MKTKRIKTILISIFVVLINMPSKAISYDLSSTTSGTICFDGYLTSIDGDNCWYFENTSNKAKTITFKYDLYVAPYSDYLMAEVYPDMNNVPDMYFYDTSGNGTATFTIPAGGAFDFWIWSDGNTSNDADLSFVIEYAYGDYTVNENTYSKGNAIIDGNLGVGVINPLEKLHIDGAIRGNSEGGALKVETEYGFVELGPQNSTYATFMTNKDQYLFDKPLYLQTGDLRSYSTSNLSLKTGTTPRMTILGSNGNVGIGCNPQYKLDVSGTIRASEVRVVSIDSFADFVFEENYLLPKLLEVNQFIQDNGHLPNIPSATEVKENGMSLVDMQVKLLQKIEELTLYAIEQQKQIERLEKIVGEIKK